MSRRRPDEPQSLRLYPRIAIQRARREQGDSRVHSRWTRETVDPFDTPAIVRRQPF